MTLHDRLTERANRAPLGDPQDVLAAARARASDDRRTGRRMPALALSAAAILLLLVVGIGALAGGDGDDGESVTVAGPDGVPAGETGGAEVTVNIEGLEGVAVSSSALMAAEDAWFEHTLTLENTGDQRLVLGAPSDGQMLGNDEIAVGVGGCGWYSGLAHSDAAEEDALMSCASVYQTLVLEPGGSQNIQIKAWRDLPGMNPVGDGPHTWEIALAPERGPAGDEPEAWGTVTVTYTDVSSVGLHRAGGPQEAPDAGVRDSRHPAPSQPSRSGADCLGLRSETVWHHMIAPVDFVPESGGSANYQETVTNTGDESCSIMFDTCPHPGELYTADGELVPGNIVACNAIGIDPEDLAPGESRAELWTVALNAPPGDYELRVPQRDGTVAALPITLRETAPECPAGPLELSDEPVYEQLVFRGEETRPQLMFGVDIDGVCTLRIARATLTLRPADSPDAVATDIVDDQRRWHLISRDAGAMVEPIFGAVDLPPAWYEGTVTVELDSGERFTHPARLLVRE